MGDADGPGRRGPTRAGALHAPPENHPTSGRASPDGFGSDLAEALGHEPLCDVGVGIDGRVYLLADDFALKVTVSEIEAGPVPDPAGGRRGRGPGRSASSGSTTFFRVTLPDGGTAYAVIREDVEDVFPDPASADRDHVREWGNTMSYLAAAWESDDPGSRHMARRWSPAGVPRGRRVRGPSTGCASTPASWCTTCRPRTSGAARPATSASVTWGRGAVHGNAIAGALSRIPDMPGPHSRPSPLTATRARTDAEPSHDDLGRMAPAAVTGLLQLPPRTAGGGSPEAIQVSLQRAVTPHPPSGQQNPPRRPAGRPRGGACRTAPPCRPVSGVRHWPTPNCRGPQTCRGRHSGRRMRRRGEFTRLRVWAVRIIPVATCI